MPSQARSLLQGSPFPREGTEVPSPRWEVSSETPLPRERRAVQGPSLPGGEHVYNMLPLRDGGWERVCHLYTPRTLAPGAHFLQANLLGCTLAHTAFQEACTEYSIQGY